MAVAQAPRRALREAELRAAPDGVVVGVLAESVSVAVTRVQGTWAEVALEGWVFARSLRPSQREGYDREITTTAGENLRAVPNGRLVAHLRRGAALTEVKQEKGWIAVRRSAWVPVAALSAPAGAASAAAATPAPAAPAAATPPAAAARAPRQEPAPQATATPDTTTDSTRVEFARVATLFAAPDGGGPFAKLDVGSTARVTGRSGEWVRVQADGWVRESDLRAPPRGANAGVTAAEIRARPDKWVGQVFEWRLQFIAVQVADELRPELPLGQPYALTRGPLPEPGFVYLIVPSALVPRLKASPPLGELRVRVRLRAARSRFLATPVAELIEIVNDGA